MNIVQHNGMAPIKKNVYNFTIQHNLLLCKYYKGIIKNQNSDMFRPISSSYLQTLTQKFFKYV